MQIGYDAKRFFFNRSGLGNYSRSLVGQMAQYYPDDQYTLFSPKPENPCGFSIPDQVKTVCPEGPFSQKFSSVWRSYAMARSIREQKTDLFHGLSNELPADIRKSGARSVVSLHDIIFIRMPELYKPLDRWIYTRKYRRSCFEADRVMAISLQTKNDLVNVWHVPEEKIDVVYQGCNPIFYEQATQQVKTAVRAKYNLPQRYILSVGTIEARKNLMLTVEAMAQGKIDIDLVACGRATPYTNEIKEFAYKHDIADRLHFFHDVSFAELPAFYQMAELLVYASFYEGFGIPILEGFESGIPVITSQGGVFPETGGDAAWYVDPDDTDSMIDALQKILSSSAIRSEMINKGSRYALRFRNESVARNIREIYDKLR